MTPDLQQLGSSIAAFRDRLLIETDSEPRPFSAVADGWQKADAEALDPAWERLVGVGSRPVRVARSWVERPRGHSKTSDAVMSPLWAVFASRKPISGIAAAGDADQARLARDCMAKLVAQNGWLAAVLDVQRDRIVNRHTGSSLAIISSDAATSFGLLPSFLLLDEIAHWRSRDLFDSLISSAAKRATCVVQAATNAGFVDSWVWAVREAVRTDPAWHFNSLPGPCASWISATALDEQRRLLPAIAFARLWLNRWSAGSGDALEDADITAAVSADLRPETRSRPGWVFVGGLDLGLKRDSSALVIVAKKVGETSVVTRRRKRRIESPVWRAARDLGFLDPEPEDEDCVDDDYAERVRTVRGTGRLRLARVRVWRPCGGKVDLEAVERFVLTAHQRLGLARLNVDPWQGEMLASRLERAGVPVALTAFTPANLQGMATATLEAFTDRQIDLYEHAQLLADLRSLRVEERQYGFRLTSPRGPNGHGDCATALALALLAAREFTEPLGDVLHEGPLVY